MCHNVHDVHEYMSSNQLGIAGTHARYKASQRYMGYQQHFFKLLVQCIEDATSCRMQGGQAEMVNASAAVARILLSLVLPLLT